MTDRVDELLARFLAEVTERPGRSWSSRGPSTPLEATGGVRGRPSDDTTGGSPISSLPDGVALVRIGCSNRPRATGPDAGAAAPAVVGPGEIIALVPNGFRASACCRGVRRGSRPCRSPSNTASRGSRTRTRQRGSGGGSSVRRVRDGRHRGRRLSGRHVPAASPRAEGGYGHSSRVLSNYTVQLVDDRFGP